MRGWGRGPCEVGADALDKVTADRGCAGSVMGRCARHGPSGTQCCVHPARKSRVVRAPRRPEAVGSCQAESPGAALDCGLITEPKVSLAPTTPISDTRTNLSSDAVLRSTLVPEHQTNNKQQRVVTQHLLCANSIDFNPLPPTSMPSAP